MGDENTRYNDFSWDDYQKKLAEERNLQQQRDTQNQFQEAPVQTEAPQQQQTPAQPMVSGPMAPEIVKSNDPFNLGIGQPKKLTLDDLFAGPSTNNALKSGVTDTPQATAQQATTANGGSAAGPADITMTQDQLDNLSANQANSKVDPTTGKVVTVDDSGNVITPETATDEGETDAKEYDQLIQGFSALPSSEQTWQKLLQYNKLMQDNADKQAKRATWWRTLGRGLLSAANLAGTVQGAPAMDLKWNDTSDPYTRLEKDRANMTSLVQKRLEQQDKENNFKLKVQQERDRHEKTMATIDKMQKEGASKEAIDKAKLDETIRANQEKERLLNERNDILRNKVSQSASKPATNTGEKSDKSSKSSKSSEKSVSSSQQIYSKGKNYVLANTKDWVGAARSLNMPKRRNTVAEAQDWIRGHINDAVKAGIIKEA